MRTIIEVRQVEEVLQKKNVLKVSHAIHFCNWHQGKSKESIYAHNLLSVAKKTNAGKGLSQNCGSIFLLQIFAWLAMEVKEDCKHTWETNMKYILSLKIYRFMDWLIIKLDLINKIINGWLQKEKDINHHQVSEC